MKIEYLLCDCCGSKIDFEKDDRSTGKTDIVRIRVTLGKGHSVVSPLSPFKTEKMGNLATAEEIVEKVSIDTCGKCSTLLENFCTTLREKSMPKDASKEGKLKNDASKSK